jgi:hypothetical protein
VPTLCARKPARRGDLPKRRHNPEVGTIGDRERSACWSQSPGVISFRSAARGVTVIGADLRHGAGEPYLSQSGALRLVRGLTAELSRSSSNVRHPPTPANTRTPSERSVLAASAVIDTADCRDRAIAGPHRNRDRPPKAHVAPTWPNYVLNITGGP